MASIQQLSISKGGVPKLAIQEAVVTPLGIRGDVQAHPQFHGGPKQALLWVTAEGIAELVQLGFSVYAGALGENLTTSGVDRRSWRIGQRYRVGEVLIELTKMREPCNQLAPYGAGIRTAVWDEEVKANNPRTAKWGLAGIYAAVIGPGTLRVGDPVSLLDQAV
jgi:MOSC domain-containing protein YiiM